MSLVCIFFLILNDWREAFTKEQAFLRARGHALSAICGFGRKVIANTIIFLRRDQQDHSADYKLYSRSKWEVNGLFDPILKRCLHFFTGEYIVVGADDTIIRKTGKKIPLANWRKDPLGPPFQANLVWGLRFLQFSVLLPLHSIFSGVFSSRAIPIRFISAPSLKKPGKKASQEEREVYKKESKKYNLSTIFVEHIKALRESLDEMGVKDKKILAVTDASYCNKNTMKEVIDGVEILARCRKNIRLCLRAPKKEKRRFYSKNSFTPEGFRKSNQHNYNKATLNYGGSQHTVRFLEIKNVYWQGATRRRAMRLIVLAPLPYVRGGKRYYRDPGYLLCTDLNADILFLIQSYLDRWQIEVNFREEKTTLGVGQAQVWNEKSVEKQPSLVVAAYAALLLASVLVFEEFPQSQQGGEPLWRPPPKRPTIRQLIGLLREQVLSDPDVISEMNLSREEIIGILRKVA